MKKSIIGMTVLTALAAGILTQPAAAMGRRDEGPNTSTSTPDRDRGQDRGVYDNNSTGTPGSTGTGTGTGMGTGTTGGTGRTYNGGATGTGTTGSGTPTGSGSSTGGGR